MADLGLLVLRLVPGMLLTGHGSQKLFGWFGGSGIERTSGWMESIGLRPGRMWGPMAGLSEFMSGVLTSLGLFHPLGPIMSLAPMGMAMAKVHWGKPIWVTEGGAELPATNMAMAVSLIFTGPGRFSMDRILGIRVPWFVVALVGLATAAGVGLGLSNEAQELLASREKPSEELASPVPPSPAGVDTSGGL